LRATPEKYSLYDVRLIPQSQSTRDEAIKAAVAKRDELTSTRDARRLTDDETLLYDDIDFGIRFFGPESDFENLKSDPKTFGNVLSSMGTSLAVFARNSIKNSLCASGSATVNLTDLYNGAAIVVSMPSQEFPQAAELAMMILGEQFCGLIRARPKMKAGDPNKSRPICLFVDEFQSICSPQWTTFFSLSRSMLCMPVVSFQQFESLEVVMPSEAHANLLIANMQTKLALRVGSKKSYDVFGQLFGDAEYADVSESTSDNKSKEGFVHIMRNGGIKSADGESKSKSVAMRTRPVVDGQVFRKIQNDFSTMRFQVICMSENLGKAQDDVIIMQGVTI
jgi:hypothetical protein